jgi:ferredoxin
MPPVIGAQLCTGCGTCEGACPLDVIYMETEAETGRPLDAPEFWPLYEKMAAYNLPILIHRDIFLPQNALDYYRMFYYDTAVNGHVAALANLVRTAAGEVPRNVVNGLAAARKPVLPA